MLKPTHIAATPRATVPRRRASVPAAAIVGVNYRKETRQAIEARGAELWFLPAYSPNLNPIDDAFSKLLERLRRTQPQTDEGVSQATWAGLTTITARDAAGQFTHAGYPVPEHHQ
ncbi:MAG: transposase [Chloroflexota bacterium]